MDTVFIEDLKVTAIVGIFPWERQVPQDVIINIDMAFDIEAAAKSDAIEDALNYAEVAEAVTQLIQSGKFKLVETLADRCVAMIMSKFGVPWVRFRCKKIHVLPEAGGVGVEIVRGCR